MACEARAQQLALYVDGELPSAGERDIEQHLQTCAECSAAVRDAMQEKTTIRLAARQFSPRPEFRAQIYRQITSASVRSHRWFAVPLAATAILLVAAAFLLFLTRRQSDQPQLFNQLADQHVSTLASANPVDVLSTDRHTVKPWFEGKLPFTFNLPEFAGTPYSLIGGKVTFLRQSPGAELIFQLRQHRISLFIVQERAIGSVSTDEATLSGSALNVCSWNQNGLDYALVGDVSRNDLEALRDLLRSAH